MSRRKLPRGWPTYTCRLIAQIAEIEEEEKREDQLLKVGSKAVAQGPLRRISPRAAGAFDAIFYWLNVDTAAFEPSAHDSCTVTHPRRTAALLLAEDPTSASGQGIVLGLLACYHGEDGEAELTEEHSTAERKREEHEEHERLLAATGTLSGRLWLRIKWLVESSAWERFVLLQRRLLRRWCQQLC